MYYKNDNMLLLVIGGILNAFGEVIKLPASLSNPAAKISASTKSGDAVLFQTAERR